MPQIKLESIIACRVQQVNRENRNTKLFMGISDIPHKLRIELQQTTCQILT